jgi:hypothetical protein
MFKTRVCDFSNLYPPLYSYLKDGIPVDDTVQYCIEGCEEKSGKSPLYVAYLLTRSRIIGASMDSVNGGVGSIRKYVDIESMEERPTMNGEMYYLEIYYNALVAKPYDTGMFHFESPEKVHAFANLIRKFANL